MISINFSKMFFITITIASLTIFSALAAPSNSADITVQLTGEGVSTWNAIGFSPDQAFVATSQRNPGPFTNVHLFFSEAIRQREPDIENRYRCALMDEDGNRIITTRGENIDFTFADNGNPNSWELRNGPFSNVQVTCDPNFQQIDPEDVNIVRVSLDSDNLSRSIEFSAEEVQERVTGGLDGEFQFATLFVGPGIENQQLRCQLRGTENEIVLVDRGENVNRETFADGGNGEWTLDVAGDGSAEVVDVICDPAFE